MHLHGGEAEPVVMDRGLIRVGFRELCRDPEEAEAARAVI